MTEPDEHRSTIISCEKRSLVLSSGSDSDDEKSTADFDDYRGSGAPSSDLGTPGDTYIDVDALLLYARCAEGWMPWPGPAKRSASLVHPMHDSLFLWCNSTKNQVSWMRKIKMKKIRKLSRRIALTHNSVNTHYCRRCVRIRNRFRNHCRRRT
jgi:hypothetical protein